MCHHCPNQGFHQMQSVLLTDLFFQSLVSLIFAAMPIASLDFTSLTQSAPLIFPACSHCSSLLLFLLHWLTCYILLSFSRHGSPAPVTLLVMLPVRRCRLHTWNYWWFFHRYGILLKSPIVPFASLVPLKCWTGMVRGCILAGLLSWHRTILIDG